MISFKDFKNVLTYKAKLVGIKIVENCDKNSMNKCDNLPSEEDLNACKKIHLMIYKE